MSQRQEPQETAEQLGVELGGPSRPLKVKVQFEVVDGEAGKLFNARQAEAIRALLEWIAERPEPEGSL